MAEQPSSRREFLRGQAAASALRGTLEGASRTQPSQRGEVTLTLARRAMACEFEVRLNASSQQNETQAALAALDLIEAIEDRITVYREDSEVVRLNALAASQAAPVEPDVFELLQMSDTLYHASGGAYDITAGPLSRVWGFSRREGRLPSEDEIVAALKKVGWQHVTLDADASLDTNTVQFNQPGVGIDFNSSGKGFALDQAADLMAVEMVEDFMLHGGRSTLLARGTAGDADATRPGWRVSLRHPLRPQERLAEFWLQDQAFSTSGSATQCFVLGGKRYGHLLDPRTGWPAQGVHSVSVIAPTGAEADALSTMLYVMGPEAGLEYLAGRPEIGALFVLPGKSAGSVRIETANLRADCWQPHYDR